MYGRTTLSSTPGMHVRFVEFSMVLADGTVSGAPPPPLPGGLKFL